ncbi:hypothetical protein [Phytohabitans aurantiacus]|uniref:Uncharacterized protein n=1 Tax=Phytohabitans aurantiacus TaxID=3016789 RepID=A0ABQ5QTU7_9ACTN|nr:hypothetical protein [Phytohabitans aurantiacus]GLH97336.1 hypothetical protein Pa4123_26110 [Phytohabitans aurantiacus]
MDWLLGAAGAIVVLGGAIVLIGKASRWVLRRARQLGHLLDDVLGEPEREGQPARPSLMARVASIEQKQGEQAATSRALDRRVAGIERELRPNGGSSVKDQITAIVQATGADAN